jgi:hypothetical protein
LYQACFKSVPLLERYDEKMTAHEVKRFFTMNGRVMEVERIERSLFRIAAQKGSEGEKDISFEGFTKLFTQRGKSLIV